MLHKELTERVKFYSLPKALSLFKHNFYNSSDKLSLTYWNCSHLQLSIQMYAVRLYPVDAGWLYNSPTYRCTRYKSSIPTPCVQQNSSTGPSYLSALILQTAQ